MSPGRDAVTSALEHAADTAEDAARDEQKAATIARDAARNRRTAGRGDSPDLADAVGAVLHLLGRSSQRLATAVGSVRRAYARALADENLSLRQIGARLGVSHQRVSALLARYRSDDKAAGTE